MPMPTAHPAGLVEVVATRDQEYLPALSADGTCCSLPGLGSAKPRATWSASPLRTSLGPSASGPSAPSMQGSPWKTPSTQLQAMAAPPSRWTTARCSGHQNTGAGQPENIDLYLRALSHCWKTPGDETVYLWSEPKPLDALNTPDGWESQPAVSPDGEWLYFARSPSGNHPDAQGNPPLTSW